MIVLLAHFSLLGLASWTAVSRITEHWIDRILAAFILAWANITTTALLLGLVAKLGEPVWFFRTSLLLGLATTMLMIRMQPLQESASSTGKHAPGKPLVILFVLTVAPLLVANVIIASAYTPSNWDSLTYHLPRVMYYLGQGTLGHFDTNNARQTFFPFNFNLLQLACLQYYTAPQVLNFLNVGSWMLGGLGVYRISRLCGCSPNGSLIAAWLALVSTQLLAQATATTNDLPLGVGLLCSVVFILRWVQTHRCHDALLAGVCLGLIVGTKLTVVFFAPAGAMIFTLLCVSRVRSSGLRTLWPNLFPWLVASAPAMLIGLPFAAINLVHTGHWMTGEFDYALNRPFNPWSALQTTQGYTLQLFLEPFGRFTFDPQFFQTYNEWAERTLFPRWNAGYAFSPLYLVPPDLNEDHVWFGFAGPLALVGALICLLRHARIAPAVASCGLLGLSWLGAHFLLYKWSLYNQRYFVPVILVMLPCVAFLWDRWLNGSAFSRILTRGLYFIVAVCSLWFAWHYVLKNTRRPLEPILQGYQPASGLPELPGRLAERLAAQSRVNIISDGANERIFLLMNQGGRQRFTSFRQIQPAAYNVISHWAFTRDHIFSNIAYPSSYKLLNFPNKPTAGIEAFGTIGHDVLAFDYFGLMPGASAHSSSESNQNVLVKVSYNAALGPDRFSHTQLEVVGLNPLDHAQVTIGIRLSNGTVDTLARFSKSGRQTVTIDTAFDLVTAEIRETNTHRILAKGEIPVTTRTDENAPVINDDSSALFRVNLISGVGKPVTSISGLAAVEGPYAQWQLPVFRWAKQPITRIAFTAPGTVGRIRLTLSVRTHVRAHARLGVYLNGRRIHETRLLESTVWYDEKIVVPIDSPDGVIEFRDESEETEPDWVAYLEQNPDVKTWLLSQKSPMEAGAKEHYELHGRSENRALPLRFKSVPPPAPPENLYFMFRTLRIEGLPSEP